MQDGLGCFLSRALFDLGILGILFSTIAMYVANKEGTKTSISKKFALASKSCCNVDIVNSLCEVCVSLGFSYFLATDLLRQYTGLKAKVMAAFPES